MGHKDEGGYEMKGWQIMVAGAAILAAFGACVVFHGCANTKEQTCSLITQGIAAIDKELEKGDASEGDVLAIYQQDIDPVMHAKGLDSVLETAKDYWSSLSTEDKLKMGRSILVFMQQQYCEGTGGCIGTPSQDKVKATIAGIVRAYAGPVLPGQRRPYEVGK